MQTLAAAGTALTGKILAWIFLAILAALISYFGFRAYANPELLLNFANSYYC